MTLSSSARVIRIVAALTAALTIAACSKNPNDDPNALGLTGGRAGAATPGTQQDFVVNVGDRVYFETDSVELTQQAQAILDKQAQWLAQYPRYTITMEGHADERGTREYNMALGERRAKAVVSFLTANGANAGQLEVVSYGEEKPAADGHEESSWTQNRRAELVYTAEAP